MTPLPATTGLAEVIQLAVAPVFLLAGVGATLNVLTSRLSRIIDRARLLEERLADEPPATVFSAHELLRELSRRAALISGAIGLCVLCGLLVSLVVTGLFVSSALGVNLAIPIAIAFVVALLSLSIALVLFLREVFIAMRSLSFGGARPQK